MKNLTKILFIAILSFTIISLTACGSGSDDNSFADGNNSNNGESGNESGSEGTGNSDQSNTGDITFAREIFGNDGNLWKPKSEEADAGGGNLVVLLNSRYTTRFDTCEVLRSTGEISQLDCNDRAPWTEEPFSCFSNGRRQTWRASFRCQSAAEIRVICRSSTQEVTFTVDDNNLGRVCERFG